MKIIIESLESNRKTTRNPLKKYLDDVGYLKRKLSKRNPPGTIGKSRGLTIPDTVARRQNESDLK